MQQQRRRRNVEQAKKKEILAQFDEARRLYKSKNNWRPVGKSKNFIDFDL